MRKFCFLVIVTVLLGILDAHAQQPALPDFAVNSTSITFSNSEPVEGEEITVYVRVDNIGKTAPTLNEDLIVKLYEGDPATNPIQISCKDVILGLEPGESDDIKTQWRPPTGTNRNLRGCKSDRRKKNQRIQLGRQHHPHLHNRLTRHFSASNARTDSGRHPERRKVVRITARQAQPYLSAMRH